MDEYRFMVMAHDPTGVYRIQDGHVQRMRDAPKRRDPNQPVWVGVDPQSAIKVLIARVLFLESVARYPSDGYLRLKDQTDGR